MKKLILLTLLLTCNLQAANYKHQNSYSCYNLGGSSYATGKTELEAYQNALNKMPKGAKQKRVNNFKAGSLYTCTIYWEK